MDTFHQVAKPTLEPINTLQKKKNQKNENLTQNQVKSLKFEQ